MSARNLRPRGFALVAVLSVVILLTVIVVFAIQLSGQERRQVGKDIHNQTLQNVTEGALQYAKSFFALKYPAGGWDTYLALFVDQTAAGKIVINPPSAIPATITFLTTQDPGLIPPVPAGFNCFVYARDDVDEEDPAPNDMRHDNNQLIYVGAVCSQDTSGSGQGQPLVAELVAPVTFVSPRTY
jgi:hypothetical protein